jgi:hypothetical protein
MSGSYLETEANERISELEEKIKRLEELNDGLAKDATELFIKELVFKDGRLDMSFETNSILEGFAIWAWEMLVHNKAENFLTAIFKSKDRPEGIVITMQRETGKTPSEKYAIVMNELKSLRSRIDEAPVIEMSFMADGSLGFCTYLSRKLNNDIKDGVSRKYRLVLEE